MCSSAQRHCQDSQHTRLLQQQQQPVAYVDPPIDDEAYQFEEPVLPTVGQRYRLYALVAISTWLGQLVDAAVPILIAVTFPTSMIPTSAHSLASLLLVPTLERFAAHTMPSVGRITAMRISLLGQRLCALVGLIALAVFGSKSWSEVQLTLQEQYLGIALIAIAICAFSAARASRTVYLSGLKVDWVPFLAAEQASAAHRLSNSLGRIARPALVGAPAVGVLLFGILSPSHVLLLLVAATTLALPSELILGFEISNSCYALHLPRTGLRIVQGASLSYSSTSDSFSSNNEHVSGTSAIQNHGGAPSPASEAGHAAAGKVWERALALAQRHNYVSLMLYALGLAKSTVLTAGPQFLLYLLSQGNTPAAAASLPVLQIAAKMGFEPWHGKHLPVLIVASAGGIASALIWQRQSLLACLAVLCLQVALQAMEHQAVSQVNHLSGDASVARTLYAQHTKLQTIFESLAQTSTIVKSAPADFVFPAVACTTLSCVGLAIFEVALALTPNTE